MRERDRNRQTDRQTDRQRETDRQIDKDRERQRQRDRETETGVRDRERPRPSKQYAGSHIRARLIFMIFIKENIFQSPFMRRYIPISPPPHPNPYAPPLSPPLCVFCTACPPPPRPSLPRPHTPQKSSNVTHENANNFYMLSVNYFIFGAH